jgi:formylglycine-generating enzyme required for sulfatase activity
MSRVSTIVFGLACCVATAFATCSKPAAAEQAAGQFVTGENSVLFASIAGLSPGRDGNLYRERDVVLGETKPAQGAKLEAGRALSIVGTRVLTDDEGFMVVSVLLVVVDGAQGWVVADTGTMRAGSPPDTSLGAPVPNTVAALRDLLDWVLVPAGMTAIGCEPSDSACFTDELPSKRASFPALAVTRTEITAGEYDACAELNGWTRPARTFPLCTSMSLVSEHDKPMNCISQAEAAAYCRAVGGRLPTVDEWEHVAKGGQARVYPWGDDAPALGGARANHCDARCPEVLTTQDDKGLPRAERVDAAVDDGFAGPAPVGRFPRGATAQGVLDLAGNVREWTSTSNEKHVEVRGGSFIDRARGLRASNRMKVVPDQRVPTLGFRCVRDVAAQTAATSKDRSKDGPRLAENKESEVDAEKKRRAALLAETSSQANTAAVGPGSAARFLVVEELACLAMKSSAEAAQLSHDCRREKKCDVPEVRDMIVRSKAFAAEKTKDAQARIEDAFRACRDQYDHTGVKEVWLEERCAQLFGRVFKRAKARGCGDAKTDGLAEQQPRPEADRGREAVLAETDHKLIEAALGASAAAAFIVAEGVACLAKGSDADARVLAARCQQEDTCSDPDIRGRILKAEAFAAKTRRQARDMIGKGYDECVATYAGSAVQRRCEVLGRLFERVEARDDCGRPHVK